MYVDIIEKFSKLTLLEICWCKQNFEDIKGVIRSRKSETDRQHNGLKKHYAQKLKIEQHELR